jgi:hypothetical protein
MKQQCEQDGVYCRIVPDGDKWMIVTARHGNVCGPRLAFSQPEPNCATSGLTEEESKLAYKLWEEFLRKQDEAGRNRYDPKKKKQF